MTYRAAVALGSNLGDRLATLRQAVSSLGRLGRLAAVSSLYETAPIGGPEQGPYLNAVVVLETEFSPLPLLAELNRIEAEASRIREERWGPRTLDLDLITVADGAGAWQRMDTERLVLPHPRAHLRRFVIEPLAEIWPTAEVGGRVAADELRTRMDDQDVELLGGYWVDEAMTKARGLVAAQAFLFVAFAIVVVLSGRLPDSPSLLIVGGLLALLGAGLSLWGAVSLGPALSPYPEPRRGSDLVASGPYRFVRHPIYSGLVICFIGVALLAGSLAGVLAAVGVGIFFWFKARYEESRLRLAVPGYAAYQERVRGRLFPVP